MASGDSKTVDIQWCVKNGDLSELEAAIKKTNLGIDDPNLCNGRPAIVSAADYGQTEVIKFLLQNGANVNIQDKHGITPLLAAAWEGHKSTVELLLKNKADKTKKTPGGNPYSEEVENKDIKKLLE